MTRKHSICNDQLSGNLSLKLNLQRMSQSHSICKDQPTIREPAKDKAKKKQRKREKTKSIRILAILRNLSPISRNSFGDSWNFRYHPSIRKTKSKSKSRSRITFYSRREKKGCHSKFSASCNRNNQKTVCSYDSTVVVMYDPSSCEGTCQLSQFWTTRVQSDLLLYTQIRV